MFGSKAAQPSSGKAQPQKSQPAPSSRPANTATTNDANRKNSGVLPLMIRIFAILLLLVSPFFLFFMIGMIVDPFWIRKLGGCQINCAMPLRYIWYIFLCFLGEVIAAVFSILFAGRNSTLVCLIVSLTN